MRRGLQASLDALGGRLVALACVDGAGEPLTPCGRCRQLLHEHGGRQMLVDAPDGPVTVGRAPAVEPSARGHLEDYS